MTDHDTLSAFRAHQGEALDGLLSDILAALMHKNCRQTQITLRTTPSGTRPSAA